MEYTEEELEKMRGDATSLWEAIHVSDCYGVHDVREYDRLQEILEEEGYRIHYTVKFIKEEEE